MKFTLFLVAAIILGAIALIVVVDAHNDLQWVYGTHGGEKCYLKGSEHGNIRYPSEPYSSYSACVNALMNRP